MTIYRVYLKRSAERELDDLTEGIREKITERLAVLGQHPRPRGFKELVSRKGYRIRIGDYRILHTIDQKEKKMELISVARRRDFYRLS